AFGRINHVQNSPSGIAERQWPICSEICKLRADGKTECLDFFRRNTAAPQDAGASLVRNEEIIGGAAVPRRIDGDGISANDNVFAMAKSFRVLDKDSSKHIRIGGEGADHHVGTKAI